MRRAGRFLWLCFVCLMLRFGFFCLNKSAEVEGLEEPCWV